jgi:hypothetical protein
MIERCEAKLAVESIFMKQMNETRNQGGVYLSVGTGVAANAIPRALTALVPASAGQRRNTIDGELYG